MTPEITALILFAAGGAAFILAGLQQRRAATTESAEAYLSSLEEAEVDEFEALLRQSFLARVVRPAVGGLFERIGSLTPGNYRDSVHRRLVLAGRSGAIRAEEIITAQVGLGLAGFVVGLALWSAGLTNDRVGLLLTVALPVIGALAPRAWLDRMVRERQDLIRRDLPDTLDLLAISVEAGVGFEGAVAVVADHFDNELSFELSRMLREMELGVSRPEALHNLRARTDVPELNAFIASMIQADALGMPVGRVLRSQAAELRSKRRQWAREQAAKLPVKIMFPLIAFIFPAILIITLAPAFSDIIKVF